MLELIMIDDNQARYESLSRLLAARQWSVTRATLKDMKKISQYSGMMLILDQDETRLNDAFDNYPGENTRIILTNTPLLMNLKCQDRIFYLAQVEPVEVIVDQVEALSVVIEDQLLLPIAVDAKSKQLFKTLCKVAKSYAPILINGETGVGKEVVAQYVHHNSLCSNGPFIAINCAALPENMIEAMLFGHEKGAFTGAVSSHVGKFEQANNGTLFLDEISELPLSLQGKILRALQEKEIERIGGTKLIKVNARIIAASNRNLVQLVNEAVFRKDLYYRLNVIPILCHALRERADDIIPLADFFIKKYSRKMNITPASLTNAAKDKLSRYGWPGNIRELENVIHRSIIMSDLAVSNQIDVMLNDEIIEDTCVDSNNNTLVDKSLRSTLVNSEAKTILEILKSVRGKRSDAAKILNISDRTLRYKLAKLKEHGIVIPKG